MARQRKPAKLGLDPASYNPVGLRAYSTEQLRTEYAALRPEAMARLESLGKSKYGRRSKTFKENRGQFPTVKQIGNDRRALERKLQEIARFVTSKRSTAAGQRDILRKQVESLHKNPGYDWVNMSNAVDFYDFLDWLDAQGEKNLFYELLKSYDPRDRKSVEHAGDDMQSAFETWMQNQGDDPYDAMNKDETEDEEEQAIPAPEPQKRTQQPSRPMGRPMGEKYPAKKRAGRRGKQKQKRRKKRGR